MTQTYLNESDPALDVLQQRIFNVGKIGEKITYMKLVKNVKFNPKGLGANYEIDRIIGKNVTLVTGYLNYISNRSNAKFEFLAGALVVRKRDFLPGDGFYNFGRELELLHTFDPSEEVMFWREQVRRAHIHYKTAKTHKVV